MEISIVAPMVPVLPPLPAGGVFDAPETPRSAQPASLAQTIVALDDGGIALGLDPHDDLSVAPQWLAWMEWVDERQPSLVAAAASR
jgi:hypothetical protein